MSIRTTAAGWAAILSLMVAVFVACGLDLDVSDSTVMEAGGLIAMLFNALGMLAARDNKVSDQDAGVRPEPLAPQPGSVGPAGPVDPVGPVGPTGG